MMSYNNPIKLHHINIILSVTYTVSILITSSCHCKVAFLSSICIMKNYIRIMNMIPKMYAYSQTPQNLQSQIYHKISLKSANVFIIHCMVVYN